MTTQPQTGAQPGRRETDVPKLRHCLRCKDAFQSEGFGERICRRCKGSNAWRSGVSSSAGSSRRR